MEVFGMTRSPDRFDEGEAQVTSSFDYLKEATKRQGNNSNNGNNPNESISFLLDTSAIAANSTTNTNASDSVGGGSSLASTKEQKMAFYSLHDTAVSEFLSPKKSPNQKDNTSNSNSNRYKSQLTSPKARKGSLSPYSLPTLKATKEEQRKENTINQKTNSTRPKINTRRSLSSTAGANNNNKKVSTTTLVTPGSGRRQQIPQTPGGFWTTNTESKTFVNGLLSPFSPLLHSAIHNKQGNNHNNNTNLATIHDEDEPKNMNLETPNQIENNKDSLRQTLKRQREEFMQYVSLQPCRKVSVVVRVTAVDEDAKRCIFPHFKDEILPSGGSLLTSPNLAENDDNNKFATPKGKAPLQFSSPTSQSQQSSSTKLSSPTHRRDVVVVNPDAFGKYIPSQVTMETAKLVAQVANIASEDWARLYEFHHVMWPTPTKSRENNAKASIVGSPQGSPKAEDLASSYNTMDSLSRAVVQDLLAEHESSLLISLGHESSCFGTTGLMGDNESENVSSIGLWPKIMNQCSAMLETKGVVRLTMVEILEPSGGSKNGTADSFRDLLAPADQKPTSIQLRHPDMKGAVLEGLCEVEIDSMPALLEALAKSRQRRAQRRKQKKGTGATATAVIGTLHYWEHAVSFELNKPPNASVTCVELASNNNANNNTDKSSNQETLESIAHRKSAVSLGQALRQLLLQQAQGTESKLGLSTSELAPVISYRETTLTKVLQRSMESSKIVLIASISPLSKDYDHTVFTLNYLRRLLVKPGNTLTSPFGGRNNSSNHNRTPPKTAKTDNRTNAANNNSNLNNDSSNNLNTSSNPANTSANRSMLSSPEAIENKEKLKTMTNSNPKLLESLVSDPRQRLAKLFGPSPTRSKKNKPWSNVLDRMEDSQKSTRGTPTAISLGGDTSTLGSNSVAANSYAGPEEARQVVESPGSAKGQPRQSWQQEDDEDDEGGIGNYQIPYVGNNDHGNDDDDESDEWASEEEIERELLASARRKERSLQTEIEAMEKDLYPQENFSYDDDDEEEYSEEGETGENHNEANTESIEVDLQGVQGGQANLPETQDMNDANGQSLEEIVPEGSYYDDDYEDIPQSHTDLSNMINDHLEESFAPVEDGNDQEPITVETVEDAESLQEVEDDRPPLFTGEDWQEGDANANNSLAQEGTEASSLGLVADQNNLYGGDSPVPSSPGLLNYTNDDSTEDPGNQTNYDLPEAPLPKRDSPVNRIRVRSARSLTPVKNRLPPSPSSPFRERQAVINSYASPYSVTLKTSKSREYTELTNEREELRATVARLTQDLKKVSEDRDSHIQQYETELQQLYGKLDEAEKAKHELETVASQAITARTSSEQEIENFEEEKEQLQRTVDSLRNDLARMTETHENQLYRHRAEIDDFQSKLDRARETQKEIEDIADEAVTAHKTQVEETKYLTAERQELQITIESLQSTMQSLEKDQGDHVAKYQQEIRQLHAKLEEATKENRSFQREADDFRFQLETQAEKLRLLNREREELHSTLSSVKGSAKKASGDHNDYLRRFKEEIQQLHTKLDDANSEKLQVEKAADEIRFEKDDLERRVKGLEEELSASRANTLRLEGIRREEQETIRKMNSELRRKDSAKIDMDHFKNELERLKRHKDHLESLVAHRKVENSTALTQLEDELGAAKRKILKLEEELSAVKMELSASRNENRELKEKLRSLYTDNSHLSRQLSERDETVERLQSTCDNFESIRSADRDTIAKLNDELRNQESSAIDIEQLNHQLSRLRQDRDYLQDMMESRKNEYEQSMGAKDNEVSMYVSQVETLKMELEKATTIDKRYRSDAESQLRSLQASEANLIQNLRQRDSKIDQLQNKMDAQMVEINSLREREITSSHAENEVIRLQERISQLEATLDITTREREEAVEKVKHESRTHKSVLNELKQSRDEVHRCKSIMKDLNEELDHRQEECLKAKERVFQMETTLRNFKKETKERVSTLADRENDVNGVLERTRNENRGLNNNLRDMNSIVERLRRERDICFQSLQDGQKKLSELSSRKESLAPHLEDLYSTPSNNQRRSRSPRRSREDRPPLRQQNPPLNSITARASNRIVPEIFVSSYQLGSPTTLAEERAEEIAACVAQSAKDSLVENFEEVSQLRSQIYRLEDERSEQVASLKAKVSNLEKELTIERIGHRRSMDERKSDEISALRAKVRNLENQLSYERVGNRTPVMGSTRRSRKQNHFVDWDEKREY